MTMELHSDRALVYQARATPARPRRLLILSHGVGGNETNLAPLAMLAPADTAVVLVRAPLTLGVGQHAWFQVAFDSRGPCPDLVAAEASRSRLSEFVVEMQALHCLAAADTVLAGFSQGGIISASVGLTRPELVRGFGVLAGRILPELEPRMAAREALAGVDAFIGHGTKLSVDWALRADAWLTGLGVAHETRLYPGDHGLPAEMQRDFLTWYQNM